MKTLFRCLERSRTQFGCHTCVYLEISRCEPKKEGKKTNWRTVEDYVTSGRNARRKKAEPVGGKNGRTKQKPQREQQKPKHRRKEKIAACKRNGKRRNVENKMYNLNKMKSSVNITTCVIDLM
ncbi:hypothetical protein RUM44_011463 [Polyplax serrata]|uniref:Uncharacterized protein n=1 Tax=Polyplax serrata TaxID=468196 RepID=A0ABR1ARM9_POLSC